MIHFTPDLSLQQKLIKGSIALLYVIVCICLFAFSGWIFSIEWIKHPLPGLVAMNPLTAICFFALTTALFFKINLRQKRSIQVLADILISVVLFITFWKIWSILTEVHYALDKFLFANAVAGDVVSGVANSMAPNTAFCFMLSSIGLFFLNSRHRYRMLMAQVSAITVLMLAVFSILGYLFGAKEFYEVQNYIPMALQTAFCFFLFSLAILFAAPEKGFMLQLTSIYSGSYMAWRLFIPAFLLPVLIGFFRLWGQRSGLYNLEFGSALFVTSIILVFLFLIWANTLLLNRREQKQEEIITEKNYLAALVEQTSDAILSTDENLTIKSWNYGAEVIYGFAKEDVIGKPMGSFLKSTLDPETSQRLLAELNAKGYYSAEYVFFNKANKPVQVLASVTVIKDHNQVITGYVAVHRDISERKKLEQQLREFNHQLEEQVQEKTQELRDVFERISDAFIGIDNDHRVVYANNKADLFLGAGTPSLINTSVFQIFSNGNEEIEEALRDAFSSREYIYLETWLDGFQKWFEFNIYPSASGLSVYMRDITIRKKALQELNASEEKYRLFFENSMDGILLTDGKGRIFSANKAATEIFGMTEEEICQGGREMILDETDPNWKIFFEERNRIGKAKNELRHFRKDKSVFLAEITSVKFRTASGDEQTNTIIRDITERKRVEEDLNESYQQIRRLTAYLQKVREEERAHIAREIHDELGQQLTIMKMDISWMKKKLKNGDTDAATLKMDELQGILDGTVASVRRIATDLRPSLLDDIGLIAAMEWEVDMFAKRTGIKVNLSKPEVAISISDESSTGLFRILQESLTNITRHAAANQVDIHLKNQNNEFILYIEDNGVGFETTTVGRKKTLGLLGMKERSVMMQGFFSINSKPGSGTRVEVRVPLT
ncbi:MAG: PAS domain S-box protein [Lacibacter sp.]|nr:PAS domain S-box protein [Lacibacter sp.]